MTAPVTGPQVLAARLTGLGLRGAGFGDVSRVVGHLLAAQAQEFQPALWGFSRRMTPAGQVGAAQLAAAYNAGDILRTHILRPTWHALLPDDARWLMRLSAPRVHQANGHPYRLFGVDERFARTTDLFAEAVATGPKTRADLLQVLHDHKITPDNYQMVYCLMRAELDHVLISGPLHGKQRTYAAFDDRVPTGYGPLGATFDRDAALIELVTRYLRARAYATVKDIAWWSGLTMRDVRRGLDLAGDAVKPVPGAGDLDGLVLWRLTSGGDVVGEMAGGSAVVDLLQGYDELFVSYRDTRHVVNDPAATSGRQDAALHVVAAGGRIIGRWKWPASRRDALAVEWLRKPNPAELAAFEVQSAALAEYCWGSRGARGPA